jgi:hypothetical protein
MAAFASSGLVSGIIAFLLTISVLSYLFGDNALFRVSVYIFIGVSAGYVAAVAWEQVISPQLLRPVLFGAPNEKIQAYIALFLAFLLLLKAIPPLSKLGTPSMAIMVGVGAAVAIGGAVLGTLFPQIAAASDLFDLQAASERGASAGMQILTGGLMLLGTVSTLIYFHFSAKRGDDGQVHRNPVLSVFVLIGKIFIAVTLGVLFAGVFSAALTAFIERFDFLITFIASLKNLWLP